MRKKGFTMVELLATIVILGIVSVTIVLSVRFIIKRSREKYYNTEREMIILSAKEYYSDNRSKLPKDLGQTDEVTLKELIEQKYIEPVKDNKGNLCVYESEDKKSKVIVQKIENNKYRYDGYLYCNGNESGTLDDEAPIIKLTKDQKIYKSLNVNIKIQDNLKVMSYKYILYKDNVIYNQTELKAYKDPVEIKLTETGIYKLEVTAYDSSGNKREKTGNYEIEIVTPPVTCDNFEITAKDEDGNIINNGDNTNTSKIHFDIKADTSKIENWNVDETYTLNDITGTKIKVNKTESKNEKFEITEEGIHQVIIKAYNAKGEQCIIEQSYEIDRTAPPKPTVVLKEWSNNETRPTIDDYQTLTDYNGEWTNKNIYTTAMSEESSAKIYYKTTGATENVTDKQNNYRSIEVSGKSTIQYKTCDLAGNCSAYTDKYNIKVDKEGPTLSNLVNGSNGNWTNKNFDVTYDVSDPDSGIDYCQYKYESDQYGTCDNWCKETGTISNGKLTTNFGAERNTTVYLSCVDKLGNKSDDLQTDIKIDKTAPNISSISGPTKVNYDILRRRVEVSVIETGSGLTGSPTIKYTFLKSNGTIMGNPDLSSRLDPADYCSNKNNYCVLFGYASSTSYTLQIKVTLTDNAGNTRVKNYKCPYSGETTCYEV